VVPTQADNSKGLDLEHDRGPPEGVTTFTTAIIPFSGHAVPTMVVLSLVPFRPEAGAASLVKLLVYPAILLIDLTRIMYTLPGSGRRA
jgi:hypothetical protein